MSTKPAITEGHINGRHDATSSQSMRVAVICALLAGAGLLAIALLVAVGRGAVASPDATPITHVCANKASGQLFSLTSCKKSQTSVPVTSSSQQFKACYLASNGVTRKVPESTKCSNKTTNKEITIPEVPADSDSLYFCVGTDGTMYFKGTTEPTCAAGQYAVVIGPHNRAPTAAGDAHTVAEAGTLNVAAPGVLANDTDAEGDGLSAVLVSGPAHASSFTLNPDGSFDYVHDGSETTSDSFTYKANDGSADSNVATVNITVTPVNDAPVAVDDNYSVIEGATLNVPAPGALGNDTDPDSSTLNAVLVSGPSNASSFTLNGDGSFTYVHDGSETTTDSFTYKANDGSAGSNIATVNITINPVNDAPVANNDAYSVNEGGTLNVAKPGFLGNDTDPENNTLTAVLVSGPSNASSFTLNPDGSFTYIHNGSETTSDSFTYKANDGSADSNVATVTITVNAVNDAPSFDLGADQTVVNTDGAQTVSGFATNISAGPSDESGQTLTFTVTNDNNSLFSVQPDIDETSGDLTYTPDSSATGTATVTVVLKDDGGTANGGKDTSTTKTFTIITVKPPNAAPVVNSQTGGDAIAATEDGAPVTITLKATDADGDDLTFSIVGTPTKGSLGTIGTPDCTTTPDTCTATVSYTPAANENGLDSFTFKANDGTVDSNTATVEIAIAAVNDAPVANGKDGPDGDDGHYTLNEDTTLTVTAPGVLGNDTDVDGDALSVSRFRCGSSTENGSLRLNADGSFSYTPGPNYNGTDSFGYRVNDGTVDSNCATVNITVNSVNDPPVVDLNGTEPGPIGQGIDTTALFTERFTHPGFPPDTCCPVVLAPRTTVSDVDDTMLESAEIKLTNHPDGNDESLSVDLEVLRETSIDGLRYDPETGILVLGGRDTLANYEKVLRTVSYDNREEPADHSDRLVTFKVNDGEADSQIATATVEIRCDNGDITCNIGS